VLPLLNAPQAVGLNNLVAPGVVKAVFAHCAPLRVRVYQGDIPGNGIVTDDAKMLRGSGEAHEQHITRLDVRDRYAIHVFITARLQRHTIRLPVIVIRLEIEDAKGSGSAQDKPDTIAGYAFGAALMMPLGADP
jgi:hypothetical protein